MVLSPWSFAGGTPPCVCVPPKILGQGHPQEACHNQDIMTLQASCIYLEFTCLLDPALTCRRRSETQVCVNVTGRGDEQLLLRPWRLHSKHHCLFQQALNAALLSCSVFRLLWNLQCLWLLPVQSLQCTWEHPQPGFQCHVCLEVMGLLGWPQAALNK